MPDAGQLRHQARDRVPTPLLEIARAAREHHILMLGAGLAFFGLISFGPAIAVGLGALELVATQDATDVMTELLEGTQADRFGLVDLIEEMEDRGAQYAGVGFLTLLWPATTLASGWTRALNVIFGVDGEGPSGLRGRLRGLVPGGLLVGAVLLLFATASVGTAVAGGRGPVLAGAVVLGGVGVQLALNLVIYRFLPGERLPWARLWRGAAWATTGVVLGTAGFAAVLALSQDFTDRFPEQLTTALVLGVWLYVTNTALLLGAEVNAARHRRARA